MKILAFGIAKEIMGSASIEVLVENGMTTGMLQAMLEAQYPDLKRLSSFAIAVNGAYTTANEAISETDEIAIIPPVSGG